jgi:cytochrome c553
MTFKIKGFIMRNLKTMTFLAMISIALGCNAKTSEQNALEKSIVCAACHGDKGISQIPIYPNIAGQKKAILKNDIKGIQVQG